MIPLVILQMVPSWLSTKLTHSGAIFANRARWTRASSARSIRKKQKPREQTTTTKRKPKKSNDNERKKKRAIRVERKGGEEGRN